MKNLKISFFFCILCLSFKSQADEVFKNFSEERFDSYFSVNYFKTDSNYSSEGSTSSLGNGNYFQITDFNLKGRYVPVLNLGVYSGLNIGNSEASDALATRRNSTLNQITLGMDYLFYQSDMMSTYVDLSYSYAADKFKADTDSSLNSNGADELKAQLTSTFNFDGIYPFAKIGLNYRTQGLSTLVTYGGGLELQFEQFVLGGSLDGYLSAVDDSKTNQSSERDNVTLRVNAGSKKFYSVNPNYLDSDLYLKYNFDKDISFKVNGGYALLGSNSAQGFHVGASVAWGFGGGGYQKSYSRPVHTQPPARIKKQPAPRFEEDTNDGVNQDYFKPVQPSKETYIQEVESKPKLQKQPVYKEMPPAPAEYKIKLKRKKKKK